MNNHNSTTIKPLQPQLQPPPLQSPIRRNTQHQKSLSSSYLSPPSASAHSHPQLSQPLNFNRTHRHKRSQAISGDFDAVGLGLFNSPFQQPNDTHGLSQSIPKDHMMVFNFNNDEDLVTSSNYSFPASPVNSFNPPSNSYNVKTSSSLLNSPIKFNKFNHNRSKSTSYTTTLQNKHQFFLTEENKFNTSENVPDALIDLDEILNLNLHIGNNCSNDGAIVEEEDEKEVLHEGLSSDEEFSDEALPPPTIYSTSANSSTSSFNNQGLPLNNQSSNGNLQKKNIEKVYSNSSSSNSYFLNSPQHINYSHSQPRHKRYQLIYDKSSRVTNAMKGSTENIHIDTPPTPINNPLRSNSFKHLNHSSSLPTLKNKNQLQFKPSIPNLQQHSFKSPTSMSKSPDTQFSLPTPNTIITNDEMVKPPSQSPRIVITEDTYHNSNKSSPRRTTTLAENQILSQTTIPKFKKSEYLKKLKEQEKKKKSLLSSSSESLIENQEAQFQSPIKSRRTSFKFHRRMRSDISDTASINSKKSIKFFDWLKKK